MLQRKLVTTFAGAALAVRKVCAGKNKNIAGIDGII